ncbi:MAG: sulfatase-like hydrolase/transferase, partial [Myxococcota bacterium]
HYYTNYIRESKRTDAEKLVDDALRFIDRNNDKRWFVYMHTIDPHVPYSAPGPWKYKHWHGGKYRGRLRPQSTGNQLGEIKSDPGKTSAIDRAYLEALYDGEVAYNDHEFGRLVEALKERGVYDNTLIVVLVDHGEEFWDHGSVGHGHSLYDEMVHSPLFIRHPGRFPRGRRLPQVVSTADVVPTMLETMGVEPMEGVEGTSLTDVFDGVGAARPRVALSDFMYRRKALRAGRYHWQTNGTTGKLYDMVTDPKQSKALGSSHPIAQAYIRGLFGMFLGAGDKSRWWVDTQTRGPSRAITADVAEVDPVLQQQLEAMGYVEGATGEHSPEEDKRKMEEEDEQ